MNENLIVELEKAGIVTSTFRKLAPDKKNALYNSALNAFASNVFDRVSLDEIAAGADVSKGSLIQYFLHKENILSFAAEIYLDNYRIHWNDYFHHEHAVRVRDRLKAYFRAHYEYHADETIRSGFFFKMMFENSRENAGHFIDNINDENRRHIQTIIKRGLQTGEIHSGESEAEITGLYHDYLNGCLFAWACDREILKDREFNIQIENRLKIIFSALFG